MDNTTKYNTEQWVYSGEELKSFLQRSDLTYKEAAEALGIDKNTVGKSVRGGNLNVDIILRICNTYGLNAHDFFKLVEQENDGGQNYYISLDNEFSMPLVSSEPDIKYKKSKKTHSQAAEFNDALQQMRSLIADLTRRLDASYLMLDELMKEKELK